MDIKENNPEIHGYVLGLKIPRIKYWSASTGDRLIEVQSRRAEFRFAVHTLATIGADLTQSGAVPEVTLVEVPRLQRKFEQKVKAKRI